DFNLEGNVLFNYVDNYAEGELKGSIENLKSINNWTGIPLEGSCLFETAFGKNENQELSFTLKVKQHISENYSLHAGGFGSYTSKGLSITIDQLIGNLGDYPLALQEPINIHYKEGRCELSPLFLFIGEGSVFATTDLSSHNIHASIRVDR